MVWSFVSRRADDNCITTAWTDNEANDDDDDISSVNTDVDNWTCTRPSRPRSSASGCTWQTAECTGRCCRTSSVIPNTATSLQHVHIHLSSFSPCLPCLLSLSCPCFPSPVSVLLFIMSSFSVRLCLQCFDTVGWASGV